MAENSHPSRSFFERAGEKTEPGSIGRSRRVEGPIEGNPLVADAHVDPGMSKFRAESKLQPGNAEAAYRLGDALLQQGKAHEARAVLERSDKLQPQMPETLYVLGKAASMEGDASAAEKAWTNLLTIEKEGSLAAQAHFGLAGLYRKQGKTEEAAEHMRESLHTENPHGVGDNPGSVDEAVSCVVPPPVDTISLRGGV